MGGFIVILYKLFHIKNIKNCPPFNEESAEAFKREYSEEKIKQICIGLQWAIKHTEIDYKNIFPEMKYSNEDIIDFCNNK